MFRTEERKKNCKINKKDPLETGYSGKFYLFFSDNVTIKTERGRFKKIFKRIFLLKLPKNKKKTSLKK
jgi:hypothetical protein